MNLVSTVAFLAVSVTGVQQPTMSRAAPKLTGSLFINSKEAPRIESGKVTLVHFWTFACHNCKANFAAYDRLFQGYGNKGLKVIGVHTPELEFERKLENVQEAVKREGIRWPILIDDQFDNWRRWKLEYWPTVYIVDRKGQIRFTWAGELAWKGSNGEAQALRVIEALLAEK